MDTKSSDNIVVGIAKIDDDEDATATRVEPEEACRLLRSRFRCCSTAPSFSLLHVMANSSRSAVDCLLITAFTPLSLRASTRSY